MEELKSFRIPSGVFLLSVYCCWPSLLGVSTFTSWFFSRHLYSEALGLVLSYFLCSDPCYIVAHLNKYYSNGHMVSMLVLKTVL